MLLRKTAFAFEAIIHEGEFVLCTFVEDFAFAFDEFVALGKEGDIHSVSETTDSTDISVKTDSIGESTITDSG
jgi:hypothetical protein